MTKNPRMQIPKEAQELLGKKPDMDVAQMFDLALHQVTYARRRAGIPAKNTQKKFDKQYIDLLGKIPDKEMAEMSGRTVQECRMARINRGIPAFKPGKIPWADAIAMPQREFVLSMIESSGLSRAELAEACCLNRSKIDQWAGIKNPPKLSLPLRKLLWFAANATTPTSTRP